MPIVDNGVIKRGLDSIAGTTATIRNTVNTINTRVFMLVNLFKARADYPVPAALTIYGWRTGVANTTISSPYPLILMVRPASSIASIKVGLARSFEIWDAEQMDCMVPGCAIKGDVVAIPVRYAYVLAKEGATIDYAIAYPV